MREMIDAEDDSAPSRSGQGGGGHDVEPFHSDDPALLRDEVARLAGLLSQRDERIRALEAIVLEDDLTGLMNRRGLYDQLRRIIGLSERYGIGAALVYIDLDRFKAVNDLHGHAIGDRILVEVGARVRAAIRRSDVAGRLGGDEFLVLLWQADHDAARGKAAAIRAVLEDVPIAVDGLAVTIGASVGVAVIETGDDVDTVITRADRDMFRIKRMRKDGSDSVDG